MKRHTFIIGLILSSVTLAACSSGEDAIQPNMKSAADIEYDRFVRRLNDYQPVIGMRVIPARDAAPAPGKPGKPGKPEPVKIEPVVLPVEMIPIIVIEELPAGEPELLVLASPQEVIPVVEEALIAVESDVPVEPPENTVLDFAE